ncbi:Subunit of heteropentameric Replication factor C (RF-C) [Sorochytrium milnesiophthora]
MDVDEDLTMHTVATGWDKGKGKSKADATSAAADTLPWVEKYRPKVLSELVSHENITSTIEKFIDEGRLPHLLFYGPPGTGKTSTILACARKMFGPNYKNMTLEAVVFLNASDERGIDVVREQIKNFASTRTIFSAGFKLIILDEADAMTQAAQAALRRVIEKYTRNVRFCIICNYVSKIIPAIQSRCTRFRFQPLEKEQIELRLQHIYENEHINIAPSATEALLRLSGGDMRRALNILQARANSAYDYIDEDKIYTTTGSPLPSDIESIAASLFVDDFAQAVTFLNTMRVSKGYALQDILTDLHLYISDHQLPAAAKVVLLDRMSELEHRLANGCSDKLQTGGLVAAFKIAVDLAEKAK